MGGPIVDFKLCGLHIDSLDEGHIKSIGSEILHAFQTHGFVYLKNTGISKSRIEELKNEASKFFERSLQEKMEFDFNAKSIFGYDSIGKERFDPTKSTGDQRESIKFLARAITDEDTKWPNQCVPKLSEVAIHFIKDCKSLALRIIEGLSKNLFSKKTESEVKTSDWKDVDTDSQDIDCVLIACDMLQYFSKGKIKSTVHRVANPSSPELRSLERRTVEFFCHPDGDTVLDRDVLLRESETNENMATVLDVIGHGQSITAERYARALYASLYYA